MKTLKRWFLRQIIRRLEADLDEQCEVMRYAASQYGNGYIRAGLYREEIRRHLAKMRSEYSILLPKGKIIIWRIA